MALASNRLAQQTRATFQTAGGCIIKFKHPYLSGALNVDRTGGPIDEIDISRCLKLDDTFFDAQPNQDASAQTILVNGDTVVITNHIMNGLLRLPVVKTSGKVAEGDFVTALQMIVASKDSVGGAIIRTEFINGQAHTRLYYGVSIKRVPHDIKMGLAVPTYMCELYYTGFIDTISASGDANLKAIWAVGSDSGVYGVYTPYEVNRNASTGATPLSAANAPGMGNIVDETTGPANEAVTDSPLEDIGAYPYVSSATRVTG